MRFIKKGNEPLELMHFKRDNAEIPQNLRCAHLTNEARRGLHESMLREQGHLCAYTMLRIGRPPKMDQVYDFRIEHIQPQSPRPDLELSYTNMVLCAFDPNAAMEFGEPAKGDREVTADNFLWPSAQDCEQRLSFRGDGTIRPSVETDRAAVETIRTLRLDHRILTNMRAGSLSAAGLGLNASRPLSALQASRLALSIDIANDMGEIAPFCIAIRQVAERYSATAADPRGE